MSGWSRSPSRALPHWGNPLKRAACPVSRGGAGPSSDSASAALAGPLGVQRLELTDHLAMTAQCEVGLDAVLQRVEPELLQPLDLGPGEPVVGEVGQRPAPPQGKG